MASEASIIFSMKDMYNTLAVLGLVVLIIFAIGEIIREFGNGGVQQLAVRVFDLAFMPWEDQEMLQQRRRVENQDPMEQQIVEDQDRVRRRN